VKKLRIESVGMKKINRPPRRIFDQGVGCGEDAKGSNARALEPGEKRGDAF
jgi:hypothetical protein